MSAVAIRHKFTAKEYYRLYETGFLNDDDRIELIDGDLNLMQAIGSRHAQAMDNLTFELGELARRRFMSSPQNPVELDQLSVPQPDFKLLRVNHDRGGHAKPADVFLVIEISDSSLRYDREVKLPVYARAGIAEYWIVNLIDDVLEVFRQPEGDSYRECSILSRADTVFPIAFPDAVLSVSSIIPKR